jgi:Glycosyltransferase sugar-binding region containing DXD motif
VIETSIRGGAAPQRVAATGGPQASVRAGRIPNVYHFVFGLKPQKEPFHLMHFLCLASCIGVNKPDAVMFHCQNEPWGEYWDRIRPQLTLVPVKPDPFVSSFEYRDANIGSLRYAHLADIARLEILVEHGGIYADMDTLFVAPLPETLFHQSFVMGLETADWSAAAKQAGGSLCNAWMMSEPRAPFAREWLARTYESFDGSWSAHSTLLPFRLSQDHPDWIHVEPARSFFHFDYYPAGLRNIFKRRAHDLEGVCSMHLWSHCWWDARTRNTARFHAGRLTPAYVRHADTTYASIARPFLPVDFGKQDSATWQRERVAAAIENAGWLGWGLKRKLEKALRGHNRQRG